jgi:hypothetical protein
MIEKLKKLFVKNFLIMEENHVKIWETMTR